MSHVWSQEEGADRPFAHADIGFLLGGRDGRLLLITAFTLRLLMLALTRLRSVADPELRTLLAGVVSPLFGILALYVGGSATTASPLAPYLWFTAGLMAYWLITRRDLLIAGRG